jgi:hypothetical protein
MEIIQAFSNDRVYQYYNEYKSTCDMMFVSSYLCKNKFGKLSFYYNSETIDDDFLKNINYTQKFDLIKELKKYPKEFWSYPKIEACKNKKEPFIFVDSDMFVWDADVVKSDSDFKFYSIDLKKKTYNNIADLYFKGLSILNRIDGLDHIFKEEYENKIIPYTVYNLGLIVCNNTKLYDEYYEKVSIIKNFKKEIKDQRLRSFETTRMTICMEQLYLSKMIYENGWSAESVYKNIAEGMRFPKKHQPVKLTHLMGGKSKKETKKSILKLREMIETKK